MDGEQRKKRVVKNELAFQAYNERRQEFESKQPDRIPFVCECGDATCFHVIDLRPDEWMEAHSREDQFVVAPGHVLPDLEHVIDRRETYWTLRKFERPSETLS
jgi:hypothetical protein